MSVKISTTNSKLGIIPSVSVMPILSCRTNCPCATDCYARKGRFRFKKAQDNMMNNLELYQKDRRRYFDEIAGFISNGFITYSYFRWHTAGDIVDNDYLVGMVELAKTLDRTHFLAFTKKFELVNNYIDSGGEIPKNLRIVFSAWGDGFIPQNPHSMPVAYVRFEGDSENDSIPSDAVPCSGDCMNCLRCWYIESGESVVFNKH